MLLDREGERVDGIVAVEDLLGHVEVAVEEGARGPRQRLSHQAGHAHEVVAHDVELVVEVLPHLHCHQLWRQVTSVLSSSKPRCSWLTRKLVRNIYRTSEAR